MPERTIAVTFDVYGHIFDADRDALSAGFDAVYRSSGSHPRPRLAS
jgi:hypothetical protein